MQPSLPLFPISLIGSWPRESEILKYLHRHQEDERFRELIKNQSAKIVKIQEECGVDILTSGELSRDNYCSFVASKLSGVTLMSMVEMLDFIEDKEAFEEILTKLDVPGFSIKNAICTDKVRHDQNLVLDELSLLQSLTQKPLKMTLPGPYLLTRSMWLPALSGKHYASKEELGHDVVTMLKQEIDALASQGVYMIQLDEPVLTEVVFTQGKPRSFMCAALSERKDPTEELEFATQLIQEVISHINQRGVRSALHVCRGNWSSDEATLLSGPYTPLIPVFEASGASVLHLEFSTPRAGEIASLFKNSTLSEKIILGLGVLNPRTPEVERVEEIVSRVKEALRYLPKEKIWLNPDCGFATFSNRPVNVQMIIESKLTALHQAALELRGAHA
ncbi:MAG: cobalamin-independent methionine synthase II family protein [Wolinella succinogenes]|uniref:cobalamin-independent methionine synthase II family protein n=1 Tax=Wolinella succinogenes TaxID=844 RepID=UPI00169200DB|nr:cobalamin-independent methionine synthase II family protein [Wolinella succinogenes]NLU33750.1 cobalamin-independent methionine synthase II family protein [Wolinella succinogenes]